MSVTYRAPVYCENGVVASPHYLASLAGVQVLQDGGNALDAAIAANAAVGVAWPHMCGIGGDLFLMMYWAQSGEVYALNASGRSAANATLERARAIGHSRIPERGGLSVTAPGAVDGWIVAHERFGSLEMERLLAPAIQYAERGFPISAWLSRAIADKLPIFQQYPAALEVFAPGGRVPGPADRLANPALARSLKRIAGRGRSGFYEGATAARVAQAVHDAGGFMDEADLADQHADWVEPLRTNYRGLEVLEMPPNTQGLTALQMFNLMQGFDLASAGHNSAQAIHWMVESKRLAFADRDAYLADPDVVTASVEWLASAEYANQRRAGIDPRRAARSVSAGRSKADGDTIYLCTADRHGNVVSLIQSLFHSFGSGVVAGGTGIVLHNRGASFNLDPTHPNRLAPRKRPFHTLIPALALSTGKPWLAFGTRGADGQPQTQAQVLANIVDFGMNPQEALEAPRVVHDGPSSHHPPDTVVLESRIPDVERVAEELRLRGQQVLISSELDVGMGTAQAIQVDRERGILMAGSDPRGDGAAIGW